MDGGGVERDVTTADRRLRKHLRVRIHLQSQYMAPYMYLSQHHNLDYISHFSHPCLNTSAVLSYSYPTQIV